MDELRSLYETLSNEGYYTKSFEEFQKQFKDTSYQDKVFGVLSRDGLYTGSKEVFLKQYTLGSVNPITEDIDLTKNLKKKGEVELPPWAQERSINMESSLADGSSESSATKIPEQPYIPTFDQGPIVAPDNTYYPNVVDYVGKMEEQKRKEEELEALREQSRQEELAKAQEQEQIFKSQNLAANKDEDFQKYLGDVNANLIGKEEEEVVPELNRRFGSYGFHFEEAEAGFDAMYVRTADGKHEIKIDLDPFSTATEVAESKKLRDFLQLHAQQPEREKSEDYIGKALRAKSMRDVGRLNDDGTYSTVKFTSYEEDGKYYVIPTLFPKDPDSYTTDKKDWMELPFEEALNEARKRGEIFEFETDEEAKEFAEGDWKDVNAYDIEGQKFYKDRGLDYYAEQKKFKNYSKLQDELELIERIMDNEFITPQEKLDNPKYFSKDGTLLYSGEMLEQKKDEVMKKKDNLIEQVFDVEFLGIGDGPVQKAREDFDLVLEKRRNEIVGEAIKVNSAAKQEYDALNETALSLYNVPIEKISTIVPKTPRDAENIDNLIRQLVKVKTAQQTAATNFEIAKTYYDAKWNKALNTEYEENWAGFSTAVADAWKNGLAAEQILLLTLGIKDVENIEDREEVARLIVDYLSSVDGSQSRVLSRLNLSRDGEFSKALLADPFETMLTFAATSFAQMAPYGLKIVPSTTAAGVAAGAAAGASGFAAGPAGFATTTGGAITGGGYGLRAGMAATMLAMEYTNSVMDVMRERGYNLLDPKQVEAALSDEMVWSEGAELGLSRGIPIAIVDYLSSGLAGRVFQTSRVASTPVRVLAQVAERAIFDPAAEAAGEYLAQEVAGQEVEWKEIAYEALGGLGNNTSMMALNLYKKTRENTNAALAYELTDINRVANEKVSDERISQWANNMHQLGKIDADVNQRIQENVGLRREAREITSVGRASRMLGEGRKVEARVMELLAAKKELTKSSNLMHIYRERISAIDQEIATIAETKKTLPGGTDVRGDGVTTAVNLDAILGTTREGVSNFKIGGKTLTREKFLKELDKMNNRRLLRARVNIENDEEVESLYAKKVKDAIQKQSTGEVSVQSETGVSPQVEERAPGTESEVTTKEEERKQEEDLVSSKTRLDEIRESLPERVKYKKNDLENFENLGEEKSRGVLASLAEKVAEGKRLTKAEKSVYDANKAQVDEFSDLAAERTAIEEEVADLEELIGKRAEFRAEERVVPATIESAFDEEGEVDFDAETDVRMIAKNRNIGITRDRELAYVARDESGKVIGGAFTSYDNETGKYTFDVVIDEESEGKGIGSKLLDAVQNIPYEISEMNPDATVEVDVVNPRMQTMLEKRGFTVSERIGQDRVIMKPSEKKPKAEFRAEEAEVAEAKAMEVALEPTEEEEAITQQMNLIASGNVNTEIAPSESLGQVDTTDLSERVGKAVPTVEMEIINGVPVVFTISDQLTSGEVTNTNTGRRIDALYGGIGFNYLNENSAWAYTSEKKAQEALKNAQKVYNENKPTLEEFWKKNPEFNGLVPMVVVKMGEGSILSNEATARVLVDNILEFPESNRKRALKVLQSKLKKEIKSLNERTKKTKNTLTKRNNLKVASGYQNVLNIIQENNIESIEQLLAPEIFTQLESLNARTELIELIGYGAPNIPGKTKKASQPGKGSPVARAIIGIPANQETKDISPKKRSQLLNLAEVTNTITEPTIADIPNRSIINIVGVDVLNPKIHNTENGDFTHPNYQYGLAGRPIGVLGSPVALVKAYPEAYNLALKGLIQAESEFVKPKKDGRKIIKPGNRLFNQPLPETTEIADRYFERTFGRQRPRYYGTRSIDKARAKRISDAFVAMEDNPNDPKVRKAYDALARETLEQYKFMIEAGYVVEINNNEPYANSREMIEDLRENKRMKIFSTESGYGNDGISPEQRERNVLLRESGFFDINGNPLLVNDVFRAVHDFFGHSELGNSFGAIGEENAWNVHVRMYSPLARQAMTTELRGQNSYTNFSGVNERVNAMRQEAANLRDQGKLEEAEALVAKVYEEISFAEQKQGILPKEFWNVDTSDVGDKEFQPSKMDSILTLNLGVQNGLGQNAFVSAVARGNISDATKLANFLNITFPGVTISTDKVSFDNVMSKVGTEAYRKGDMIVYGVTVDGDIYINPDVHNSESALFNTTIHEFGHVWTDYLQTSKKGKQIYQRGVQLIEEGIANDEKVKQIFEAQMKKYSNDRKRAINETMAILIGDKGETIANAAVNSKFKEWLLGMWRFIKESFKMSKDLTPEEIQNLTLDGFIGTALADIFSGKEISMTEAQKKQLKNPDAMFSNTQSMQSIIQIGRANGFSDAAIKQVLINRGFKASDVANALVVQIDINTDLPREFANIQGGVQKGYQLFTEVRAELQRFAHMGPRGGIRRQQTKTWSEIREKAIELLKANPIYKAQSDTVQMELISAFDRTIGTRANANVTRQISAIRNNLRQRKIGAKELQQAKIAVKNLIRSALPKSSTYSQAQINKLITIISNATESSILADTDKIMNIVEQQRAKMKKSIIKDMITLVSKKAKAAMTTTGKRRSAGLDPEGQAFFAQVKPILKAVINNDTDFMLDLANELAIADADGSINEAILKENRGEQLTIQEQALLNKAFAFDTFGDLQSMDLEEVQLLFEGLKDARAESIRKLSTRREVRAMRYAALNEQATDQISELNPVLFVDELIETGLTEDEVRELKVGNEVLLEETVDPSKPKKRVTVDFIDPNGEYISFTDGQSSFRFYLDGTPNIFKAYKEKIISRPKSKNERVQDRAAIRRAFQQGKIWSGFKQIAARWDFTNIIGVKDFLRKRFLHLGSLMNLFDNESKGLTFFRDNVYRLLNRMDEKSKVGYFFEMANLDSIANSIPGITKGYKQIRNMLQTGVHAFTINGKEQVYNADQLLRIYALSLNEVQADKLDKMGWDAIQISKIKDIVGPEAIEFANKLVDYFSNDYYESVNNVYSHVNDVNLGYIPNYFPTITEAQRVNSKLLEDGDFNGIFNAETAPALKERSDTSGLIDLNYDFTDVVESHFTTMEKYKAYAQGVKDLNAIFQNKAFDTLLEESGLKSVVKRSVNFAITPNAGQKEEQTMLGRLMTKFTGFALAFKAVQIIKQATSFVNAFEDYSYFPPGSKVPGLIKGPVDLMMFMVDSAVVIATMPKQIRKAYNMSASVRDRLLKGIEGDVYGLESGSNVFSPISKRTDIWARAVRAYKTGAAGPTVLGDILGVMGYMVNYNRNIANGMSEAEALEVFNDYNATQQTRRGTEKIPLQQNNTELSRAFTMFGSTVFLQINKVLNTQTNIYRSLKEGKMPKAKDIRGMILNLGVANALFVGAANLAKFIKGDDDDRREVLVQMRNALLGLNLIKQIPLIGAAAEMALAKIQGENLRPRDNVVNPYMQIYRKIERASKDEIGFATIQPLIEIVIGAQLDPFIGLYNGFQDGFNEENVYDILGISKSYRPTQENPKTEKQKPMTREDMKRYFPDMYDELYGKYSETLNSDPAYEMYEKQIDAELQAAKDAAYGYQGKKKK